TVRDFLRIYYDIGQDNVLPIFIIQNGMPKQKAIAVLRDDQYVGDISNKQAIYINLVNRKVKRQLFELSLPIEPFNNHLENRETHINRDIIHTTYRIENSKSKTKVIDADRLLFETDVNVTMRLLEQTAGLIVDRKHVMEILEREAEKKMTRELEQLLTQLQELNADPFGYGKYFRVKQKGGKLTREKWREKFPNIKVNFKVNVDIIRHGVVE
ncbi:MAG TPA: Ger(x)C family spore germination C-terminal domain-containing protein, partial [Virgibacillus sp.]|nr:Ger(x)C family spore germination C-terminal domain-containing protein [Virgibacillus sp.]